MADHMDYLEAARNEDCALTATAKMFAMLEDRILRQAGPKVQPPEEHQPDGVFCASVHVPGSPPDSARFVILGGLDPESDLKETIIDVVCGEIKVGTISRHSLARGVYDVVVYYRYADEECPVDAAVGEGVVEFAPDLTFSVSYFNMFDHGEPRFAVPPVEYAKKEYARNKRIREEFLRRARTYRKNG